MQLTGLSNRAGKWQKQLLSWDGKATVESQEALMFMTWYTELTRLAAHVQPMSSYLVSLLTNGSTFLLHRSLMLPTMITHII